jgi:DNA excision repair protein ERCC-3
MAPIKRKAAPAAGRQAKRAASGVSTPVSMGSDDEYRSDGDDPSDDAMDEIEEVPRKYDG